MHDFTMATKTTVVTTAEGCYPFLAHFMGSIHCTLSGQEKQLTATVNFGKL